MTSDEKLLKEYVKAVVDEGFFRKAFGASDEKPKKGKIKTFLNTLKSLFTGRTSSASDITEDWLEDQQLNLDFDLPEEFTKSVAKFVSKKYPIAMNRAKGDEQKADQLIRRALDARFRNELREFQIAQNKADKIDDDEESI